MKNKMKKILKITTILGVMLSPIAITSCATTGSTQSNVKPYPLDTCIVTDSKLGSMGDPVSTVYNGQEVKFCCAPCIKKFEKEPGKYLKKLR